MAKQRRAERRQSGAGGGGGRTGLALVLLAAIAGGGVLLYRHTAVYQGSGDHRSRADEAGRMERSSSRGDTPASDKPVGGSPAGAAKGADGERTAGKISGVNRPVPQAPFGESEEVFETGAKVYVAHCASCHGQPGRSAAAGTAAVQLWEARAPEVQRMIGEPAGAIYEQIAGGVAAANGKPTMAGYRHVLSETEMWDVALLLRNVGQELPDPVLHLLRGFRAGQK